MKKEQFVEILKTIKSENGLRDSRSCMALLKNKFPSYLTDKQTRDNVLLAMAHDLELAPTLLARIILEKYYERKAEYDEEIKISRGFITKLMKDTTLIGDKDLAYEIHMTILQDDQYGPLSDTINHSYGQQYEFKLARFLEERKIPFQDEEKMRALGFDKTPDIKLDLPIAVNGGFIIHWIESKALFGSEEWHENFVKNQLSTYWNRYGPGMVIYWFDFVDSIQNLHGKNLLVSNELPESIVQMDPSLLDTFSSL